MIATKQAIGVHFETSTLRTLKPGSKGVLGIKIALDDEVASATLITSETAFIASTTSDALVKKTSIEEYPAQGRGTKGRIIHKLNEGEQLVDIIALAADDNYCCSENFGEIETENIPEVSRNSKGTKIF